MVRVMCRKNDQLSSDPQFNAQNLLDRFDTIRMKHFFLSDNNSINKTVPWMAIINFKELEERQIHKRLTYNSSVIRFCPFIIELFSCVVLECSSILLCGDQ